MTNSSSTLRSGRARGGQSQVTSGNRSITGDTVLRLGRWSGTGLKFWLSLRATYDVRMAEAAVGPEVSRLPVRPRHEKRVGA